MLKQEEILMKNSVMNPFESFALDPLFDLFSTDNLPEPRGFRALDMKTDIKEVGNNYVMEIDLPGVNKKDISVALNDGYLTVEAKVDHETSDKDKKGNFVHRERFSGVCSRSYYVGAIDEKDIAASYADGVLSLSFPKEEEKKAELAHKIEVK